MKTYTQHYLDCQREYNQIYPDRRVMSVYDLRMKYYQPHEPNPLWQHPSEWDIWISSIQSKLNVLYRNPSEIYQDPADNTNKTSYSKDLVSKLKNPWQIEEFQKMAATIIPQIERSVYNSFIDVTHIHCYRNISSEADRSSSFLYHLDNVPDECNKLFFYLTPVENPETDGPFEIIRDRYTKEAILIESTRQGVQHCMPHFFPQNRVPQAVVDGILSRNGEKHFITGKAGTTLLFNNNCLHRASPCKNGSYRDVVIFLIRPSLTERIPRLSPENVGDWRHESPVLNPEASPQVKK